MTKWGHLKIDIETNLKTLQEDADEFPTTKPRILYTKIDILEKVLFTMRNLDQQYGENQIEINPELIRQINEHYCKKCKCLYNNKNAGELIDVPYRE